ncbi:MAG: hypothetical protein M3R59_03000 [Verrucomicrobiota bacterium]|nr:hypothetical protein [Verrucomicrobiota bacterium]
MVLSRFYPLAGLLLGYALVMLANPIRRSLRDGLRCLTRYERIWLTFVLLGFSYLVFQFATFTPIQSTSEIDFAQIVSISTWHWPGLAEVWQETPLPSLESVAGIFDNATTTYPFSVIAAVLLLINWRGLHGTLWRALRKRYRAWSIPIYLVVLISTLAALVKPVVYWRLAAWSEHWSQAHVLKFSASVDAISFIFEYFAGVYIQVYLIAVCLAWIKGLSFREGEMFEFAVRRFSYVLEWSIVVVGVGLLVVRLPLLLAYFIEVPNVLDYMPLQRVAMSAFLLAFCSVQISLVLHNEDLGEALRAHWKFMRHHLQQVAWFFLIAALHFFLILVLDAVVRGAISDRVVALVAWKFIFVCLRALITGWLLATWVILFRRSETMESHHAEQMLIRY